MAELVKVVLDGTLFAECQMQGANRDGMMRLTEDITQRLVLNKEIDISFASSLFIEKYDTSLKSFVAAHYPDHINKIFSKSPPLFSNILKWKQLFRKRLPNLPVSPYFREINGLDVFHSFYYPFTNTVLRNSIKRSITFLDIIPLRFKGYPNHLINRTKQIVECIASDYAISISDFSKQDLLDYDKRVNPEKVFVVPLAASKELFYQNKNESDRKRVKEKYGFPDNYFLCLAGNDIRKNVPHIVKCFNKFFLQEKPTDLHLVLTGNGSHSRSMLDVLNISKPVRDRIFIPDRFIDSTDLAVLYSNAKCFFFMSLYEGFGLPTLEAMQCGVPTVSSNTTSLPEVVGDAGILLSPTDEDELCEVMSGMYKSTSLSKKYEDAGLKRAESFSWQRCADEYAAIFKTIASH